MSKNCSIKDCDKDINSRGWCSMHYQRWQRNGDVGEAGRRKQSAYMAECSIVDCERPACARSWCKMHHQRWMRSGSTDAPQRPPSKHVKTCLDCGGQFRSRVEGIKVCPPCRPVAPHSRRTLRSLEDQIVDFEQGRRKRAPQGIPLERYVRHHTLVSDGCWEWSGSRSHGYGKFRLSGTNYYAHRVAYEIANGAIPAGMVIDHMCRNTGCIKPAHLQAVTQKGNNENRSNSGWGSTGVRGVSFCKRGRKFEAYAMHNDRKYSAGRFDTLAEAEAAAREMRTRFHTNNLADFEDESRREYGRAA